ncbi:MAG: hypothetical protein AAF292_16350 [Pseudomonadota bacterium]
MIDVLIFTGLAVLFWILSSMRPDDVPPIASRIMDAFAGMSLFAAFKNLAELADIAETIRDVGSGL